MIQPAGLLRLPPEAAYPLLKRGWGLHDVDSENEWLATLDWSAYRRPHTDWVGDGVFLPGVVDMFASQVCAPYPSGIELFLGHAGNTPPGRMILAEEAFAHDGTPLHSVHQRLDALVRAHADDLEVAIARPDVITFAEWDAVVDAGQEPWTVGQGARRALAGIAPIIARLAAEKRISCHARHRKDSNKKVDITGPEWWDLDPQQAVRRIASGGINLAAPYDPDAETDHLIFVSRDGLQNAIAETQSKEYVAIAFLEYGKWALRRRLDHYAVQVEEVADFLIGLMNSGRFESATNEDFMHEVSKEFGSRGLARVYERAKAIAINDPERARFGKRRSRA